MAATSKATKSSKTTAPAKPKAAPRGVGKAAAKIVAIPGKAKPAKVPAKKAGPAKLVAAKPAAKPAKPSMPKAAKAAQTNVKPISAEQRRNYIEVAAYFIAERSGFSAANALDHWTQAEAEIDRLLREGKLNV